MQRVKPGEIDIAAIHDINGAGFGNKQVERMHVVQFTVGDVDEAWDISSQIKQGVHLNRRLGRPEVRPGKDR